MPQHQPLLLNTYRCHRDYSAMPATANGRYCSGCRKEVRDFSGMEPELVLQVLQQNNGSVCARIEASKVLYRPELYQRHEHIKTWFMAGFWSKAAAAATAFLLLLSGKAAAQETAKPNTTVTPFGTTIPGAPTEEARQEYLVLKGKVTDAATKEEIPFANVVVKHKGKQLGEVAANFDGVYEIKLKAEAAEGLKLDIEFSYVGYTRKTVSGVVLSKLRILNAQLTSDGMVLGDMVGIVHYRIPLPQEPGTRTFTKEEIQKSSFR